MVGGYGSLFPGCDVFSFYLLHGNGSLFGEPLAGIARMYIRGCSSSFFKHEVKYFTIEFENN